MTFWQSTQSDLFEMYPPMRIVDLAKILLCVTMLLTFPLPFFSCRELLIVAVIQPCTSRAEDFIEDSIEYNNINSSNLEGLETGTSNLQEPLLENEESHDSTDMVVPQTDSISVIFEDRRNSGSALCGKIRSCYYCSPNGCAAMVPGEEKQLALPFHMALTMSMWGVTTFLAIVSPNLGDILDLVGAASGTAMAFILPGLLSFKLQGYTTLAAFILVVGGAVGFVGTGYSMKKLVADEHATTTSVF
jgi:hypothetical protein